MRPCNRFQPTGLATYDISGPAFARDSEGQAHAVKSKQVLFFFMCRSTCSHCWKQVMALAKINDMLLAKGIEMMLVGDGKYKDQARQLIDELNLPFRYVSDNGALRRYYHLDASCDHRSMWTMLLVDGQGVIRFSECDMPGGSNPQRTVRAVEKYLAAVYKDEVMGHIMRRSKTLV